MIHQPVDHQALGLFDPGLPVAGRHILQEVVSPPVGKQRRQRFLEGLRVLAKGCFLKQGDHVGDEILPLAEGADVVVAAGVHHQVHADEGVARLEIILNFLAEALAPARGDNL